MHQRPPWIESMVFNREGCDASSAWDERAMVFTVMRVGFMSPWTILIIIIAPEPKWNWSSKSHWAVINHHESPLDCHKSHSIPNIFPMNIALKCQANPPIKGWNPPFSHLFGASEANAASRSTGTTVTWRPCCQRRCEPTEAAKMPGICGNLRWFYGGSSWNLMLKMLTFRKLLVIYDSYGDLIWSNDI